MLGQNMLMFRQRLVSPNCRAVLADPVLLFFYFFLFSSSMVSLYVSNSNNINRRRYGSAAQGIHAVAVHKALSIRAAKRRHEISYCEKSNTPRLYTTMCRPCCLPKHCKTRVIKTDIATYRRGIPNIQKQSGPGKLEECMW